MFGNLFAQPGFIGFRLHALGDTQTMLTAGLK
jgi:hypothetical protein